MKKMTTKRVLALTGLAGSVLAAGGCVSQEAYDDLLTANRSLTSRNEVLATERDDLAATVASLRESSTSRRASASQLEEANSLLRQQLTQARDTILDLEDRLGNLELGRLDAVTDAALARLADQYPGLISYDSAQGVLRFASDLTFDSGSAVVKDGAKGSISALGNVLTSPEANVYDIIVVGHTDSQPIGASRDRHPTNMHLSAHRAISVRAELQSLGVPANRLQAAGWGEHRPLVANNATGGTPGNRRVEIYLVPSTLGFSSSANVPTNIDRRGINADFDPSK